MLAAHSRWAHGTGLLSHTGTGHCRVVGSLNPEMAFPEVPAPPKAAGGGGARLQVKWGLIQHRCQWLRPEQAEDEGTQWPASSIARARSVWSGGVRSRR